MIGRTLPALLFSVLAVGCSADQTPVEEMRPAVVVQTPPPDPPPDHFQSELLPGAPRVADAAPNPARGGQYPIGRAGNPVPSGYRVAPVTSPPLQVVEPPAVPATEAPTTTTSAPAGAAPAAGAQAPPSTTTTTAPLLESEGIDP